MLPRPIHLLAVLLFIAGPFIAGPFIPGPWLPVMAAERLQWNSLKAEDSTNRAPEIICSPDQSGAGWDCTGSDRKAPAPLSVESLPDRAAVDPLAPDLPASLFVLRSDLPADQSAALPPFCYGDYVLPPFPLPLDADSTAYPLVTEADQIESKLGESVQLEGDVRFTQGNRSVSAGRAHYDSVARQAQLTGGVRITEPTVVLQGEQAHIQIDTKAAELDKAQFLLTDSDYRGHSRKVVRNDAGDLVMHNNRFTRCEPGNDSWRLDAKTLTIRNGEIFGTARNAVLRVKGVPVFYTPYIQFPVSDDRQSGFLFPGMGYSGEDGIDLALPYYLNLAPNYDATVVPRYMSERGAGLDGEFRLLSNSQNLVIGGGLLPKDDIYNGKLSKKNFAELFPNDTFKSADRWLLSVDQVGRLGPAYTNIDYTEVSDRDYFRDLDTDFGLSSEIQLERRGEVNYSAGSFRTRLWAQDFQRLDEIQVDPYARLPELTADYDRAFGLLQFNFNTQAALFDRDTDNVSGIDALTGERFHVRPSLKLPFTWPFGHLTLASNYSFTQYNLKQDRRLGGVRVDDLSPDRSLATGSIDGGLVFERDLVFRGSELTQTLEPRVFYLYRGYENQDQLPLFDTGELTFTYSQLFREDRFAGLDRLNDANQVSAGVTSRFLDRKTGTEHLRMSIGQIKYLRNRRVSLYGLSSPDLKQTTSAVASELEARFAKYWWVGGGVVWDPNDNQFDESSAFIQYRRDNAKILNVGYRQRVLENIQQTDLSMYWPVTRHYSLMGRWNYDLKSDRTIEAFAGIEYNDCCWQVRVMARRFLDSPSGFDFGNIKADKGIFIQFVFKGLAGIGGKTESVLTKGIRGYYTEDQPGYANW